MISKNTVRKFHKQDNLFLLFFKCPGFANFLLKTEGYRKNQKLIDSEGRYEENKTKCKLNT